MAEALHIQPEPEEEREQEKTPSLHSEGPGRLGGIFGRSAEALRSVKEGLAEKRARDDAEIEKFRRDVEAGIESIQKVESDLAKAQELLRRIEAGEKVKRANGELITRQEVEESVRINKEKLRKSGGSV
jgi:Skp family chaperone for outer membrane proteins